MRILLQLSLLFSVTLLGEAISWLLPFTFPGTLIAMFLLLLLLGFRIVKEHQLEETADFFSRYMAICFVPAGVEILESAAMLRESWLPIVIISVISLLVTFLVAAKAVEIAEKAAGGRE